MTTAENGSCTRSLQVCLACAPLNTAGQPSNASHQHVSVNEGCNVVWCFSGDFLKYFNTLVLKILWFRKVQKL